MEVNYRSPMNKLQIPALTYMGCCISGTAALTANDALSLVLHTNEEGKPNFLNMFIVFQGTFKCHIQHLQTSNILSTSSAPTRLPGIVGRRTRIIP